MKLASRAPAPRAVAFCWFVTSCWFLASCGGGGPGLSGGDDAPYRLSVSPESLAVRPGESRTIEILLMSRSERPVASQVIALAIVGTPGGASDPAQGATLSAAEQLTDHQGRAGFQVRAGVTTAFRIRLSTARADDFEVTVFVSEGSHASAEIVPLLDLHSPGAPASSGIALRIYDGRSCATLDLANPAVLPEPIRPERTIPPTGSHVFDSLAVAETHAVVGLGRDQNGTIEYSGCVDLPGALLLENQVVRIFVPLARVINHLAGTFVATSELQFTAPPPAATTLRDAWRSLSRCSFDPAQTWIDCTIDALSETTAADPLDCKPAADSAEGPLAIALAPHRGVLQAATDGPCRSALDQEGRASLEATVKGRALPTIAPILSALPTLADEIDRMLLRFRVSSTLTFTWLAASGSDGRYWLDHSVTSIEAAVGPGSVSVPLVALGAPQPTARFIDATLIQNELKIAPHAFAVRVGSALRQAFMRKALAGRALPDTEIGLVRLLFDGLAGCAGLDELLCTTAGAAPGCLLAACERGLTAYAEKLAAGFAGLDGADLDLFLGGAAKTVDDNSDRRIDRLGQLIAGTAGPGLWSGELKGRSGAAALTGFFVGTRLNPAR